MDELFEIGKIIKIHGLKGQVKFKSFVVEPDKILQKAQEVFLRLQNTEKGPLRIVGWRVHKEGAILSLDGIDHAAAAESLVGFHVLVSTENLEALPEDEYYWRDLIGMTIVAEDGEVMGILTSIFPTGSNDVYVCVGEKGEMMIPAISDVVLQIDKAGRKMVIRFLKGMDRPC